MKTQEDQVNQIEIVDNKTDNVFPASSKKFVDGYSKIVAPLTDLMKTKQPNKVRDEANHSFNQLKEALCNASILKLS